MPRLFTGIELPASAAALLASVRGGISGARWIEPEDYHLTLRFIGDVDIRTANEIANAMGEVRRQGIGIQFEGLNWFGGDKPRAIVAKIKSTPGLIDLRSEHERRLRRLGLPPETRKYLPHVTLARLRSASTLAVADYLGSRGALFVPGFDARRFVIYSARDAVGGGPYVVEAAYPLL
jgi:RNA 2',3'-cyclic 3'-phosphodiesterase